MKPGLLLPLLLAAWLCREPVCGESERSQAEGLPGVAAANTVGLGDIWVTAGTEATIEVDPVPASNLLGLVDSNYQNDLTRLIGPERKLTRTLRLVPHLTATFGLAHFIQFTVDGVPWDGQKIGTTSAWIQCTLPGNDGLRFLGAALAFGTTLSTQEDVYERNVTTPGFEPIFHVRAALDADLVRYNTAYPLKFYLNYDNFEDERLIHAYDQNKFQAAVEWKGFYGGPYVRWAAYLYRRLPTVFDSAVGRPWKPLFHDLALGYRWMAGDRFTFTAELSFDPLSPFAFYRDEARKPPQLLIQVSAPLLRQETQAEALRALLFTEAERKRLRTAALRHPAGEKPPDSASTALRAAGLPGNLDSLSLSSHPQDAKEAELLENILGDKENEIRARRQKIRAELKEIEALLP